MKNTPLTFLISQPRAGSTLTQRMIGAHPEVFTSSEPWILLHPLLARRTDTIVTKYSQNLYKNAVDDFNRLTPNGAEKYRSALSSAYVSLYDNILREKTKKIFLDKTPRYYYIIKEIIEYFPDARIIILLRNPLAVLNSLIHTWARDSIFMLSNYRDDLVLAPNYLIEAFDNLNVLTVKYEDILAAPEAQMTEVCKFMGIEFDPQMLNHASTVENLKSQRYGDKTNANKASKLLSEKADSWKDSIKIPQYWRLTNEYLIFLGEEKIARMGYDYGELCGFIESNKPSRELLKGTYSLDTLLDDQRDALIQLHRYKEHIKFKNDQIDKLNKQINLYKSRSGLWSTVKLAFKDIFTSK